MEASESNATGVSRAGDEPNVPGEGAYEHSQGEAGGPAGGMSARSMGPGQRKAAYLVLLLAGCLVPYARFVPWLVEHGLDVVRFQQELFEIPISSFFGWDVIIAIVTLLVVAALDRDLRLADRVLVGLGSLLGASVGLPLYLWLRERRRSAQVDALRTGKAIRPTTV